MIKNQQIKNFILGSRIDKHAPRNVISRQIVYSMSECSQSVQSKFRSDAYQKKLFESATNPAAMNC